MLKTILKFSVVLGMLSPSLVLASAGPEIIVNDAAIDSPGITQSSRVVTVSHPEDIDRIVHIQGNMAEGTFSLRVAFYTDDDRDNKALADSGGQTVVIPTLDSKNDYAKDSAGNVPSYNESPTGPCFENQNLYGDIVRAPNGFMVKSSFAKVHNEGYVWAGHTQIYDGTRLYFNTNSSALRLNAGSPHAPSNDFVNGFMSQLPASMAASVHGADGPSDNPLSHLVIRPYKGNGSTERTTPIEGIVHFGPLDQTPKTGLINLWMRGGDIEIHFQ